MDIKNNMYYRAMLQHQVCKILGNIFIFGSTMAKNQVVVMTSFFKSIFRIFNCRTAKQMTFLESSDKTGQDSYVFQRKLKFPKFDLFDLSMT